MSIRTIHKVICKHVNGDRTLQSIDILASKNNREGKLQTHYCMIKKYCHAISLQNVRNNID
jgi:hypothetical protein